MAIYLTSEQLIDVLADMEHPSANRHRAMMALVVERMAQDVAQALRIEMGDVSCGLDDDAGFGCAFWAGFEGQGLPEILKAYVAGPQVAGGRQDSEAPPNVAHGLCQVEAQRAHGG